METLYDRLGVPRDVDPEDLRRAWKRIVRTVHPDVGGDTAAFQDLEKAYDVLSHANTRAFYDLALDTYRPGASQQPMPTKAAVPPPEWISDLGGTTVLPTPTGPVGSTARGPRWPSRPSRPRPRRNPNRSPSRPAATSAALRTPSVGVRRAAGSARDRPGTASAP